MLVYERLVELLSNIPGGEEREIIRIMLGRAKVIVLSNEFTSNVSKIIEDYPKTVEQNLDFVNLVSSPMWIEWDECSRYPYGQVLNALSNIPRRVGALLWSPDNTNFQAFISWISHDERVDYSPVLLAWNKLQIDEHSRCARKYYGNGKSEVMLRMLTSVSSTIPESFRVEVETMHSLETNYPYSVDEILERGQRDATAEVIFIWASLIAMHSPVTQLPIRKFGIDLGGVKKYGSEISLLTARPGIFNREVGLVRKQGLRNTKIHVITRD